MTASAEPVRFMIAQADPSTTVFLEKALAAFGQVVGSTDNGREVAPMAQVCEPDIAILDADLPVIGGIEAGKQLLETYPKLQVVITCRFRDLGLLRSSMEAGAASFLVRPFARQELESTIQELVARKNQALSHPPPPRLPCQGIWSFVGAKTSEGRTSALLAMAGQLHELGRRVAVVDLDLVYGDVGFYLGLPEGPPDVLSISSELATASEPSLLAGLRQHSSGLAVLPGPTLDEAFEGIDHDAIIRLVQRLEGLFHYVLVDMPLGLPEDFIPLLDCSRLVFTVTRNLPATLRSNRSLQEILSGLGYSHTKVRTLVLDEPHPESPQLLELDVEGIPGFSAVPFDPEEAETAVRAGQPMYMIEPGTPFGQRMRSLVMNLVGRPLSLIPVQGSTPAPEARTVPQPRPEGEPLHSPEDEGPGTS